MKKTLARNKRITTIMPLDAIPGDKPRKKWVKKTIPLSGLTKGVPANTEVELKLWGLTFSGTAEEMITFLRGHK